MEPVLKTRLLGAAVLVVLAVVFVPMLFPSNPPASGGDQSVSLAIPPAPDRDLQTKTMSLTPGAPAASATAAPVAPAPAVSSASVPRPAANASSQQPLVPLRTPGGANSLPAVNIPSNRPHDVDTQPAPGKSPPPTPGRTGATAMQPLIPAQPPGGAPQHAAPADQSAALPAATAARGNYSVNLSAYSSSSGAQNLMQRVRGLGYPVSGRPVDRAGKTLTLVSAGPFESRAAAEAARLKISQSISGLTPTLQGGASTPAADAPAPAPTPAAPGGSRRAGGFAVQVAAMGNQGDANALRDRLRASGFDGFVDSVNVNGKQLWRVRVGPQTQRADAERLRDQVKAKLGIAGNIVGVP